MLVLEATGFSLIDACLPEEVTLLAERLAAVDAVLDDPGVAEAVRAAWERSALCFGRPTIPMATYLRVMYVKTTTGWGYERLMDQISDSLQLRRFCRIAVIEAVPDESTIRKLTRRLGHEVVDEATRAVISKATCDKGFRPRALRADSTVADADIRYPTDVGLCADAVRVLARAARQVQAAVPDAIKHVVDRSRSVGKRVRGIGRSLRRRTGEAKEAVRAMTEEAAERVRRSLGESRKVLAQARASSLVAEGVSEDTRERAIAELERFIEHSARVADQIKARFAGEKITSRLVSLFDPDARPIRRGKLAKPNEFGYLVQFTEVTASTKHGTTSLLLPPQLVAGSSHENALLPGAAAEVECLGLSSIKEGAFDAGFARVATAKTFPQLERIFIAGSKSNTGSQRTRRRLARYRVGCEGRIAETKRDYHAGRCRLKGTSGARIWESWVALSYDTDTVARM